MIADGRHPVIAGVAPPAIAGAVRGISAKQSWRAAILEFVFTALG